MPASTACGGEQVVGRAERPERVVLAGEDELVRVRPEDRDQVGPGVGVPREVGRRVEVTGVDGGRDDLVVVLRPGERAGHVDEPQPRIGGEPGVDEQRPIGVQQGVPHAVVPDRQVLLAVVVRAVRADAAGLGHPGRRPVLAAGEQPHPERSGFGELVVERLEGHALGLAGVRAVDRTTLRRLDLPPGEVERTDPDVVRRARVLAEEAGVRRPVAPTTGSVQSSPAAMCTPVAPASMNGRVGPAARAGSPVCVGVGSRRLRRRGARRRSPRCIATATIAAPSSASGDGSWMLRPADPVTPTPHPRCGLDAHRARGAARRRPSRTAAAPGSRVFAAAAAVARASAASSVTAGVEADEHPPRKQSPLPTAKPPRRRRSAAPRPLGRHAATARRSVGDDRELPAPSSRSRGARSGSAPRPPRAAPPPRRGSPSRARGARARIRRAAPDRGCRPRPYAAGRGIRQRERPGSRRASPAGIEPETREPSAIHCSHRLHEDVGPRGVVELGSPSRRTPSRRRASSITLTHERVSADVRSRSAAIPRAFSPARTRAPVNPPSTVIAWADTSRRGETRARR